MFKLDEARFAGHGDPIAALVLCGAHRADHVMVAGRWTVEHGQIPGLDMDAAFATAFRHGLPAGCHIWPGVTPGAFVRWQANVGRQNGKVYVGLEDAKALYLPSLTLYVSVASAEDPFPSA